MIFTGSKDIQIGVSLQCRYSAHHTDISILTTTERSHSESSDYPLAFFYLVSLLFRTYQLLGQVVL